MEKDIIDVVMEKQYFELSSEEKQEIAEYCSNEDEYNHLRDVMLGVESLDFDSYTPKEETKQKLDDLFDETYPKAYPVWYMSVLGAVVPKEKPIHRQPLVQIAALALLVFLAVPLFNNEIVPKENEQLAMVNKSKEDSKEQSSSSGTETKDATDKDNSLESNSQERVLLEDEESEANVLESAEANTRRTESLLDLSSAPISSVFSSAAGAISTGFDHPDGVFDASVVANSEVRYSVSAGDEPDVLDLLTATF